MQAVQSSFSQQNTTSSSRQRNCDDLKGAQFVIQSNLKIMARAISALGKISEDVFIEISKKGLTFQVYNVSKSAFSVFHFSPEFFNSCDMTLLSSKTANFCRISLKAAQTIFKGLNSGEKNFMGCEFQIDPKAEKMLVKMQLNYDISKTFHARLLECPPTLMKSVHDRSAFRNTTVVFASVILPILNQLKNDFEVTLAATEHYLHIKNYQSDETETDNRAFKKVRTETKISADKLSRHRVTFETELTFSIREFLAVVTLAEQLSSEIALYYDMAGRPFVVSVEAHPNFEIELSMATTTNDDDFEVDGGLVHERSVRQEQDEEEEDRFYKATSQELQETTIEVDELPPKSQRHSNTRSIGEQQSPIADRTWRNNEIEVNDDQIFENHVLPEHDPTRILEPEQLQGQPCEPEEVGHQTNSMANLQLMEEEELPFENNLEERVIKEEVEDEYNEDPFPKRQKLSVFEEARNKKLRKLLMGTRGQQCEERMSQQFAGRNSIVSDTQF